MRRTLIWLNLYGCQSGCLTLALKQVKNTKNALLACFRAYVWQSDNHLGWATSMPFASINPTNPRTNLQKNLEKILRIGRIEKLIFFWVGHFEFLFLQFFSYFLHPHKNLSNFLGQQGWVKNFMFSLVSSKFLAMRNISLYSVT